MKKRATITHAELGRGGQAVGTDQKIEAANLRRLIEGQMRRVQKMVEDQRYCADILDQIAAIQSALRLRHCATAAIRKGPQGRGDAMYDELLDLMRKNCL